MVCRTRAMLKNLVEHLTGFFCRFLLGVMGGLTRVWQYFNLSASRVGKRLLYM